MKQISEGKLQPVAYTAAEGVGEEVEEEGGEEMGIEGEGEEEGVQAEAAVPAVANAAVAMDVGEEEESFGDDGEEDARGLIRGEDDFVADDEGPGKKRRLDDDD